jgi:hypothetical protein
MTLLASAIAFATTVAGGAIANANTGSSSSGNQLTGTWTVTVNRPAPLPPLQSLQVYSRPGTMVESANDSPFRSPQYGSWKKVHDHLYAATGVFFRFDPQGTLLGKQTIDRTIVLTDDGNSFTFSGRATIYDASGNVLARVPVGGSGERLEIQTQT